MEEDSIWHERCHRRATRCTGWSLATGACCLVYRNGRTHSRSRDGLSTERRTP
jgi:hypothetical protein